MTFLAWQDHLIPAIKFGCTHLVLPSGSIGVSVEAHFLNQAPGVDSFVSESEENLPLGRVACSSQIRGASLREIAEEDLDVDCVSWEALFVAQPSTKFLQEVHKVSFAHLGNVLRDELEQKLFGDGSGASWALHSLLELADQTADIEGVPTLKFERIYQICQTDLAKNSSSLAWVHRLSSLLIRHGLLFFTSVRLTLSLVLLV